MMGQNAMSGEQGAKPSPKARPFFNFSFFEASLIWFPMIDFDPLSRVSNILYSYNLELENSFILLIAVLIFSLQLS